MTDRQPGAPGQYILTVDASVAQNLMIGMPVTVTLIRDDQPVVEGTPYNKASVLPDDLAALICPDVINPTPADAFRGLKNVIDEGLSTTLLWQNGDPTSDFADQKIALDLSAYTHILLEFVSVVPAMILRKSVTAYCNHLNVTSTSANKVVIELRRRTANFDDSRVSFSDCNATMYTTTSGKFADMSTNNASVKPFRIYGLKGVD